MSAAGKTKPSDRWLALATALRLIVGWCCVTVGAVDLLVELDRSSTTPNRPYVFFHVTLLVGGMMLLALDWMAPKPGRAGYVTGGAILIGGTLVSAIPATTSICCMPFASGHGFPFTFIARDAGRWHFDVPHALADVLCWGLLGLLVLVVVGLFRRAPEPEQDWADEPAPPAERQYIEHRKPAEQQAEQKTVRPLP